MKTRIQKYEIVYRGCQITSSYGFRKSCWTRSPCKKFLFAKSFVGQVKHLGRESNLTFTVMRPKLRWNNMKPEPLTEKWCFVYIWTLLIDQTVSGNFENSRRYLRPSSTRSENLVNFCWPLSNKQWHLRNQ